MARIVDYADVLNRAETLGLRSAYYNTGAFTFPASAGGQVVGWMGPDDASIRAEFAAAAVRVPPPYPQTLAALFGAVWPAIIDDDAWLMPKSHWAFELDHGNGPWLAPALAEAGVDAEILRHRTDGSAIAFSPGESSLGRLIATLLEHLKASDFAVLFPTAGHVVTVHHHQQLWWQTTNAELAEQLRTIRFAHE